MKRYTSSIIYLTLFLSVLFAPKKIEAQTTPFYNGEASPCPAVLIEQKYDHVGNPRYRAQGWDTAVTCSNPTITLTVRPAIPVQYFNGTYLVEEIPYNPPDPTFYLSYNPTTDATNPYKKKLAISNDDDWAPSYINIAFPFYFFGYKKTKFILGDNGIVTFATPSGYTGGGDCPFATSTALPWPSSVPSSPSCNAALMRDAIYSVYEDTHTGANGSAMSGNQGIYYGVIDNSPCRKIIASWNEIPLYPSSSNLNNRQTYQAVCYEGSNIIEIHVKRHGCCSSTNSGNYILGIQNATGQTQVSQNSDPTQPSFHINPNSPAYFAPSGWNCVSTSSTITNKAYRFTPQGPTTYAYKWYRVMPDGDSIVLNSTSHNYNNPARGYYDKNLSLVDNDHKLYSGSATINLEGDNVEEATYVCELRFMNANNDWYFLYDTVTIGKDTVNTLQLTANTATSTSGESRQFDICQGTTAQLPLHYTNVQQPDTVMWTIYRIMNGQQIDLPEEMVTFSENDTALTLSPDPNFEDLPKNKIDSIYVRAVVDFVSGCTNYDTILVRVFPNFDTTEVHGICNGEVFHWDANGQDYTRTTNSPTITLHSAPGCDSVVHLDLTVYDVSLTIDHISDCKPITWLNGKTYSTSNSSTAQADTILLHNRYGCDSIVRLDFTIHPLTAILSSSLEYFDYDHIDVELTDISVGGDTRVWHFPTGADQTAATAYYSIPVNLDSADIKLIAHSPYGCLDSTHIVIPFNKETFWMPNAFTPDNPAGNTTFGSVSTKTVQQEMIIYNRYGEMVYCCSGVDCKWDGRNLNGQPCPQGAYAYIIRYTNEYEPQVTKIKKGTVTLIR